MFSKIKNTPLWVLLFICVNAFASGELSVIGGRDVTAKERPWVVKINFKNKGHCTGTLIARQWIITAAHCFAKARPPYTDFMIAGGGDGTLINLETLPSIAKVFIHPNYRGSKTTAQDLALLRLSSPITVADNLAPIPLKNLGNTNLHNGPSASLTAWGLTDSRGTIPDHLQSITLPVKRTIELGEDAPEYIRSNEAYMQPGVLTMIKEGVTSCRGDSGGGWTMVIGGSPYLIGVHSAGDYCKSIALGAEISQSVLWIKTRMLLGGL